ncbi:MAG: hypothetical protein COA52_10800 [Hyphomicrobiales bacterium]|nr:MAG: hypothetical protein COA52_10800 [Hyphomicrobiales bacterium]
MSIAEFVTIIEDNGKGVRGYIECSQLARIKMEEIPDMATAYFLLSIACDRFVDAYDDQPLFSQKAEDEFVIFKSYVDLFAIAEKENSETVKMKALNDVARKVAEHKYYLSEV